MSFLNKYLYVSLFLVINVQLNRFRISWIIVFNLSRNLSGSPTIHSLSMCNYDLYGMGGRVSVCLSIFIYFVLFSGFTNFFQLRYLGIKLCLCKKNEWNHPENLLSDCHYYLERNFEFKNKLKTLLVSGLSLNGHESPSTAGCHQVSLKVNSSNFASSVLSVSAVSTTQFLDMKDE